MAKDIVSVKQDYLLAAAILHAYPKGNEGSGLPEIEDISDLIHRVKSSGVDIGDISLRRIPGGFYSENLEILLGHFLDSEFAKQKSPVQLTEEGLQLLRQIVEDARKENPEAIEKVERILNTAA